MRATGCDSVTRLALHRNPRPADMERLTAQKLPGYYVGWPSAVTAAQPVVCGAVTTGPADGALLAGLAAWLDLLLVCPVARSLCANSGRPAPAARPHFRTDNLSRLLRGEHQVPAQADQDEREGTAAQQGGQVLAQDVGPQVPRGRGGRRARHRPRGACRSPRASSTRPPARASSTPTRPRTASRRWPSAPPRSRHVPPPPRRRTRASPDEGGALRRPRARRAAVRPSAIASLRRSRRPPAPARRPGRCRRP